MAEYWEKFKGGPTKPVNERVHITLNPKGVFTFNRNVFKMLGSPRAAVLYFNRADCVIGITAAHPKLAEAFPVVERPGYWVINAAPFCRHFEIRVNRTERFNRPDIDHLGVLKLDLATTVSVGGRKRRSAVSDQQSAGSRR